MFNPHLHYIVLFVSGVCRVTCTETYFHPGTTWKSMGTTSFFPSQDAEIVFPDFPFPLFPSEHCNPIFSFLNCTYSFSLCCHILHKEYKRAAFLADQLGSRLGQDGSYGLILQQAVIGRMTPCSAFFWESALTISSVNLVLLVPDNDALHGPAVGHRAELSVA